MHFMGEEILVHERLGDVFMGKCTYLRKEEGGNVHIWGKKKGNKSDVKFRHLESMTKKRSSEILVGEKTYFEEKSYTKKCHLQNFS